MILLELSGHISVVGRHPKRSLQAIGSQVSKRIDAFETGAVGKMKWGDRVAELTVPPRLRQVSKSQTVEGRSKDLAMRKRFFQQAEERFHRIAAPSGCGQILSILGQQS